MKTFQQAITKKAYVSPFHNPANRYSALQMSDLGGLGYEVGDIYEAALADWTTPRGMKVVVLNWFEDRLASARLPLIELIRCALLLLVIKIRIKQIVWVRHNYWPHELKRNSVLQRLFLSIIYAFSSKVVCHREIHKIKSHTIPHPLYVSDNFSPSLESERDIEFLLFGSIRPNKNIDILLEQWPESIPLRIIGLCKDSFLLSKLNDIITHRNLNVNWENRFIDNDELDKFLNRTRYAVIPNPDDTMIVSGAFYHAASFGVNILMNNCEFSNYAQRKFSFVQRIDGIRDIVSSYAAPEQVISEVMRENSTQNRFAAWHALLPDND